MSVAVSRVLLGRLLAASLCAAAVLVGVHGAAVTRDGQDSGTVWIATDGCAHCPEH